MRHGARLRLLALGLALVALAACGTSSLSAQQLRAKAGRICAWAQSRTAQIPSPSRPGDALRYLSRGVQTLAPELAALRALRPSGDQSRGYRQALKASADELAALRTSVRGLKSGDDPVLAIRILQHQLAPVEAEVSRAWHALDVAACVLS